ncbi:MAG: ATP-binding protein [Actinomycetota bacterium]|nr:ATP-binding protein [Actinomycetota bacterium]
MAEEDRGESAPLQVDAVLDVILSSAARIFEGEGSVMLVAAAAELEVVAAPDNPTAVGARVPFGQGIAGKVAQSQTPVLVSGRTGKLRRSIDSAMCVPLVQQGHLVGILNLAARGGRNYSNHDLAAAGVFAGIAANALAEARLYERQRREGAPDAPNHLAVMLKHMKSAASVDFVEPASDEKVDAAAVGRALVAEAERLGRPTDLRGPRSVQVLGRAQALHRALKELLDNAHLHGRPPVRLIFEAESDRHVLLTVSDNGLGIPPAARDLVFEPFGRLDRPTDGPGLGLGLTIARRLLEAMGATVAVVDPGSGGAAVRIRLNRAR